MQTSTGHGELFDEISALALKTGLPLNEVVQEFEWALIGLALKQRGGNQSRASLDLGMHRNTFVRRIQVMRAAGREPAVIRKRTKVFPPRPVDVAVSDAVSRRRA